MAERILNISEAVIRIEGHVEKTNGRVTLLEKKSIKWQAYVTVGWAVGSLLIPIIFILYVSDFKHDMKDLIKEEVTGEISNYIEKE